MTFEEAVTAYKTYARAEGKSPATVAWVSSSIRYFTEFLGPELPEVQAVTGDDLRQIAVYLDETLQPCPGLLGRETTGIADIHVQGQ